MKEMGLQLRPKSKRRLCVTERKRQRVPYSGSGKRERSAANGTFNIRYFK